MAVLNAICANLLDTVYEFYEFNDDLRHIFTNEYQCHKAG